MTGGAWISMVVRRLLAMAVLLVLISFLVFSLTYLAPGDAVANLLGTRPRTPEMVRLLSQEYHLDKPFLTQYWLWARDALRLHFGNSVQTTLPVTDEIRARLPTSIFLGAYAFILTMVFGVALGIATAVKQGTSVDRGIVSTAVIGLSTPAFVSGILLLYLFAIVLPWFPAFGKGAGIVDTLWHLTLPAISLAIVAAALVVKHTRAAMIGVLDQDYVTFARARGLSAKRVLFFYSLRNALIPVVTISALTLSSLITGAVLVEVTFSLQGIGGLLVQSAQAQDLPMVQGVSMLIAIIIIGANLIADLAYIAVDPRIRLGRGSST
jgi:peptide/nickel transport system permease protein